MGVLSRRTISLQSRTHVSCRTPNATIARCLQGGAESWNVRDRHMAETLAWLRANRPKGKTVVWAHNSHLGDARATGMAVQGEVNLGQLARERWNNNVFLLGFTTHSGEVTAASRW